MNIEIGDKVVDLRDQSKHVIAAVHDTYKNYVKLKGRKDWVTASDYALVERVKILFKKGDIVRFKEIDTHKPYLFPDATKKYIVAQSSLEDGEEFIKLSVSNMVFSASRFSLVEEDCIKPVAESKELTWRQWIKHIFLIKLWG